MTAMPFTLAPARPAAPTVRPGRREGRGTGPQARPTRALPTPRTVGRPGARGCSVAVGVPAPAAGWRLTDRGVGVILVVAMMIMVAALVVIGLTALRVTGDGYAASPSSQLAAR